MGITTSPETTDSDNIDQVDTEQLWEEIGFYKPLAGFWYNLIFSLFSMVIGIVVSGFLINYLYPFPESMGYKTAATGIFSLFFSIFDLGTHMTMDRFIAESRIKNPQKMIQYLQYFIYYQMTTGLIQTTAVSIYALYYVPQTELSYAVWIMLIHSTTQFPGFLGVFKGALKSMQRFDKSTILDFISGEVFQRITEIVFLILGRMYGEAHPEVGVIMGIAFGATIGLYVDDFLATIVSAKFFSKAMAAEGVRWQDCFHIDFDWPLVKETLIFGVKTGLPGIIGLATELMILYEYLTYVPQYTTFITLHGIANGITGIVNMGQISVTMLISESYLNGKKNLTQYYIAQTWRFASLVQAFLVAILLIVYLVLEPVFLAFNVENYILAIPFIFSTMIRHIQQPYTSLADNIITGSNKPNFLVFIRFCEEALKLLFMSLWIVWLRLPQKYGINAIVWIIPCGIYPAILFKTILNYIYINKKIVAVKIPWWQSIIAPWTSTIIVFFLGLIIKTQLFDPIMVRWGILPAIIVMISCVLVILLSLYFPLTTILGGWDDDSLREFHKAAKLSGPSRFIVYPMYRLVKNASTHSSLHNRFKLDSSLALKEAAELVEIKRQNQVKFLKSE